MKPPRTVLVLGSGAREHALAWRLLQDPEVGEVVVAPGNGGTLTGGLRSAAVSLADHAAVVTLAQQENADLVVVGPEQPLVDGLVDALEGAGVLAFGPRKNAARLEGDKAFSKEFMREFGVPTAGYEVFSDKADALAYIRKANRALVVKASGLAAGKGVVVAKDPAEAHAAVERIMGDRAFGAAGDSVVIEECLRGQEVSYHVICDGSDYVPLAPAQDHKRAYNGDEGPNTGGMGAYSPPRVVTDQLQERIHREVVEPTLGGLVARGTPFRGVLFVGLMIEDGVPKVLEYNVRFGDPECQTLMTRLGGSFFALLHAAASGTLAGQGTRPVWRHASSITVVLASGGYPGKYETGLPIQGLAEAENLAQIFHAGTRPEDNGGAGRGLVTSGGRVLSVTAAGDSLIEARDRAYRAAAFLQFQGAHFRDDIGHHDLGPPQNDL